MPHLAPRLLMLLVLAFYATGGARWSHERVAHGQSTEPAVAASHACQHSGHDHASREHAPAPDDADPPGPPHDHDCAECQMLGAMKPAPIVAATGVAIAPAPRFAPATAPIEAPRAAPARPFAPRGPPRA